MKILNHPEALLSVALLCALVAFPVWAAGADGDFLLAWGARVLIYAIAASALNIALGFGGMVSLGHALFLGLGMYSVALPALFGISSGWVHLALAMASCALAGGLTGLISLRTSGIAFIMITLAFAQMGYFVMVSLKQFGGDDGLGIALPSQFFGLSLSSPMAIYLCAACLLLALTLWVARLRSSPFGTTLRASRQNPRRVASLGLVPRQYQLAAYIASAVICGLAGILLANLNAYASPSSMSWVISGELIVMVVLGGMGTVMGPVLGAIVFLGAEEGLKALTENWLAVFGLAILGVALVGRAGLVGEWVKLCTRWQRKRQPGLTMPPLAGSADGGEAAK